MIAMLSHDNRFPVRGGKQMRYRDHATTSSWLPDDVASPQPILTCQTLGGASSSTATCLDSTELSAAQALLNLTPSSSFVQERTTPTHVFRGSSASAAPVAVGRVPSDCWFHHGTSIEERGTRPPMSRLSPPTATPLFSRAVVPSSEVVTSDSVMSSDESSSSSDEETPVYGTYSKFYDGTTSLALDTDEDFLSPLHCFMRRYCVEAFSATSEDVVLPRHGGSYYANHGHVVAGQVGIRCLHCKHRPVYERAERAVCFPSSLKNIYHSIETWQRRHSLVCQDIPDWVKREMTGLIQGSKSCAGGRRGYWEESAARIGLADTKSGIRFVRAPGDVGMPTGETSLVSKDVSSRRPVVEPDDRVLVTDYLFLLLDQMETCKFTEEDRAGGRSKVKSCPVGFPGMQCKHCAGKAGFGRYFPANLSALTSANSDRNIFNHIQKCRRCPTDVKQDLLRLRDEYQRHKNRRGSRKVFFQRVWNRLQD